MTNPNKFRGFTLVEVMVVVAIIALLATIAMPQLMKAKYAAEDAATMRVLRTVANAIELYAAEQGEYPGSWDIFIAAGYLLDGTYPPHMTDEYRHEFFYRIPYPALGYNYYLRAIQAEGSFSTHKKYRVSDGGSVEEY
jgi:type II secretion system protein G